MLQTEHCCETVCLLVDMVALLARKTHVQGERKSLSHGQRRNVLILLGEVDCLASVSFVKLLVVDSGIRKVTCDIQDRSVGSCPKKSRATAPRPTENEQHLSWLDAS